MKNYEVAKKEYNAGATFLGVALALESIPAGIFRSLAALMGIKQTRTKSCPFCEETIRLEASTCGFCSRVLMKQINFNQPGDKNCGPFLK